MTRKHIPDATQTELFRRSMRRCALCFGLNHDFSEKRGQVAHLNQDNTQTNVDDLVWLCVDHHDLFDSTTRQTKNYTKHEVQAYRARLYEEVERYRSHDVSLSLKQDHDRITSILSQVLQYIPYIYLPTYIHDFPEMFSQRILMPVEAWETFKRCNPHVYPFSDNTLNILLDNFFVISSSLNKHIHSYIGMVACFESIIDYNGTNHKLKINSSLDVNQVAEVMNMSGGIKSKYISAYNDLTSYMRNNYPKITLNGYREQPI